MEKDKNTPKYRYDHVNQKMYVEPEGRPVDAGELVLQRKEVEHQRPEQFERLSAAEKLDRAREQGRIAHPEQFSHMSDGELARRKSELLGQLSGALDASSEQNDYMVDNLMAKALSAQAQEDIRKNAAEQVEASKELVLHEGNKSKDRLTRLDKADIEQVAALLEGPLQEAGDNNFLQVLSALERFYNNASEKPQLTEDEKSFAYEKITALLEIAEAMRFTSNNPVAALPPGYVDHRPPGEQPALPPVEKQPDNDWDKLRVAKLKEDVQENREEIAKLQIKIAEGRAAHAEAKEREAEAWRQRRADKASKQAAMDDANDPEYMKKLMEEAAESAGQGFSTADTEALEEELEGEAEFESEDGVEKEGEEVSTEEEDEKPAKPPEDEDEEDKITRTAMEADEMDRFMGEEAVVAAAATHDTDDGGQKQSVEDVLRQRYARLELPDTEEFEALPDEGLAEARDERMDRMQHLLDDMPDHKKVSQESLDAIGVLGDELIAIDHVRQLRMVQSGNRHLTPDNIPNRLHKMDLNHLLQSFPADINSVNRLNSVYYGLLHRAKAVAGHESSRQLVRDSLTKVELLRDYVNRKMLLKQHGWDDKSRDELERLKLFTKPRQDR